MANLQWEIIGLLRQVINTQNNQLKNRLTVLYKTKFETKSIALRDATAKISNLVLNQEYQQELVQSLHDEDSITDVVIDLDLASKRFEKLELQMF